jgi:DUF1680 family protein
MEQLDQAVATGDALDFPRFVAHPDKPGSAHYQADLLQGVVVLEHPGALMGTQPTGLYQDTATPAGTAQATALRLIPYYAWSNRELSAMQVWIPDNQGTA